jgi:hypothetical protein
LLSARLPGFGGRRDEFEWIIFVDFPRALPIRISLFVEPEPTRDIANPF